MATSRVPSWIPSATLVQLSRDTATVYPDRAWEKKWHGRPMPAGMVFRVERIDNDPRCSFLLRPFHQDGVLVVHNDESNPNVLALLGNLDDVSATAGGILAGARADDAVSPTLVLAVLLKRGVVTLEALQSAAHDARERPPENLPALATSLGFLPSTVRVGP